MLDQKTLHAALKKVSAAMMHLENTGFEEKYPIGLIDINLWEWPQGVGLYGLWKLFERTKDGRYLATLREYYDARIADGLPGKNINTMAPVLALSYLYEYTGDETYGAVCKEWAQWVMDSLPKTKEGGFQHITSDTCLLYTSPSPRD